MYLYLNSNARKEKGDTARDPQALYIQQQPGFQTASPTPAQPMQSKRRGTGTADKRTIKMDDATTGTSRLSRRGTRIALVTAPIVALAVILGVLLGRKGGGDASDGGGDVFVRSSMTTSPSVMPSAEATAPRLECPTGRKEFELKYSKRKDGDGGGRRRRLLEKQQPHKQQRQRSLTEFSIWYVKDACTGEKVVSCMSSCPSSSSRASPLAAVHQQSDHMMNNNHNNDRYLQNEVIPNTPSLLTEASRQCIPSDGAYVFVVESAVRPNECCGFDPTAEYVVTFDGVVVAFAGANGNSSGSSSIERKVLFGQFDTPCASNSPSETQSVTPSAFPSAKSSMKPITNNPSVVSSDVPSISSSSTPSSSPSIPPPTMNPTFNPTTKSPTESPTKQNLFIFAIDREDDDVDSGLKTPEKEEEPPIIPTLRPTCNNDQDFNLCLAVDMSGSICSSDSMDKSNSGCIGCPSDTCRDDFVTEGTCCNNFAFIKGFAKLMIQSLSNFPADKTFSVVQFSTEGRLVSLMESNLEAKSTIDELSYTGGIITNHAEAISQCRQSLSSSLAFQQFSASAGDIPHKSIMMLITDGVPTTLDNDQEGAATLAASQAKEDGMFIIPVFISPRFDADVLSFMSGLSSDGKVFDVMDYESLDTLKDRLLEEVSCSLF